jgi:translation initiation factor 3 subunit M
VLIQIRELVDYLARGLTEEARIAFIKPFSESLVIKEGEKQSDQDADRRRRIVDLVLAEVKNLGQGSERGISLSTPI